MAETDQGWIREGSQPDGTRFRIARDQWEKHRAKRPEIADGLSLVAWAMKQPKTAEPDRHRPDEERRGFRLFTVAGRGKWRGYILRVSVKYVQQPSGEWIKFYQSCWYERAR